MLQFLIFLLSFFTTFAENTKFCIYCKHFKPNLLSGNQFGKCDLFPEIVDNKNEYNFLVNGVKYKKNVEYQYCSIARKYDEYCGKDAKYFEKQTMPQLPTMIPDCVIISAIRDKMMPLQKRDE